MPKEGYKSITVSNELYEVLQRKAEKAGKSLAEIITVLVSNCKDT